MPANIVRINDADDLEWYVGDSKMPRLLAWLKKNGYKQRTKKKKKK